MNFLSASEWLRVTSMSLPLIVFYSSEVLIGLTDLVVVAPLGVVAISAVGLGKTIIMTYAMMAFGVLSVVAVVIGDQAGKARKKDPELFDHGTALRSGLFVALLLGGIGYAVFAACPLFLRALDYDPLVVSTFTDYFSWAQLLIVPALLVACFRSALNALASTAIFAWLAAAMVILNALLNVALVHGFWIIPGFGVLGAGSATAMVHAFALLFVGTSILRRSNVTLDFLNPFGFLRSDVKRILALGLPAGGQQFIEGGLFLVVLFLMGTFSTDWLAATSVMFALLEVTFVVCLGFSEVVSAEISRKLGAGDFRATKRLVNSACATTAVFMAACGCILWVAPEMVLSLFFGKDATVSTVETAVWMTLVVAPFLIFDGLQVTGMYMLRGMQDTIVPFVVGVAAYWLLGLGSSIILAYPLNLGPSGIWYGFCSGLFFGAIVLVALAFFRLHRIQKGSPQDCG